MSPLEARRLVGHDDRIAQPQPSPTQRSHAVGRLVLAMVIGGLVLTMCASPRAAEPDRIWTVVDATTGKPWTSAKGNQATATNPTACDLALVEASTRAPAGTRLRCSKK